MSIQGCPELRPNVRPTGLPVCVGTGRGALCRGCGLGWQGSHMLPAWWGAGHQPPQQPDAPEPVCGSKAFPSGDTATWPSPAQLQSQGFQRCVSKGPGCTVFLAQSIWPGRDIWPTPQPGHPWPLGTQGQGEPNEGKAMLFCVPAK